MLTSSTFNVPRGFVYLRQVSKATDGVESVTEIGSKQCDDEKECQPPMSTQIGREAFLGSKSPMTTD
jgi:hypothetical protein